MSGADFHEALDDRTRATLRAQGFDPDTGHVELIKLMSAEFEVRVDDRLEDLWRVVFGRASMPGEPGFGPCSSKRRHFFTSIIGECMRYKWPWHEGLSDDEIRRVLNPFAEPASPPVGFVLLDGGKR